MFYHYKVRQVFTLFNSISRKPILESTHKECPSSFSNVPYKSHKRPRAQFARSNSIACKFTLVSTHEEYYPFFGNVSYKAQKTEGKRRTIGILW